jgi:8-oxo-dGTP pyrophosphatase MutT (NUDIX family)
MNLQTYNAGMIAAAILNRLADRLEAVLAWPTRPLVPWSIAGHGVGDLDARRASLLALHPDVFVVENEHVQLRPLEEVSARSDALDRVARELSRRGELTGWRDERYPVCADGDATPLACLERAAARFFGIRTEAAHVNGTVEGRMWIARRSASKPIDPDQLDNMVGGGIAAGVSVRATVVKEAWEEAGVPTSLAISARAVGCVHIHRLQPDGLQRERIHVHDLELPRDFVPQNQDGEVDAFELVDPARAAELAGAFDGRDAVTADAALVIADWLLRHGHVPAHLPVHARLVELRGAR